MIRACVNRFSHIADSRYREFPTDTELFGPMTSLARLFHEVDVRVAKENNVTLVPYYDASVRYSGLQVSCVVRSFCIRQPVCVCVGGGGGVQNNNTRKNTADPSLTTPSANSHLHIANFVRSCTQCDGLHYGKSDGVLYGCHGFAVVTDVVLQSLLNAVCGAGRDVRIGCT
jgi:hypothetical protein